MRDPVIAADGITYERESIELWLSKRDTSPFTGALLPNKTLIPNIAIRSAAQKFMSKEKGKKSKAVVHEAREKAIAQK